MPREFGTHGGTAADEIDPNSLMPRSGKRTIDNASRRVIAAHGINRYTHVGYQASGTDTSRYQ
jgi:hypothetical protein